MFIAVERENHALGGGLLDSTAVIVHTPIGGPSVPLPERLFGDRTRSRTPEPFFGSMWSASCEMPQPGQGRNLAAAR